jgi:hypothetical protein
MILYIRVNTAIITFVKDDDKWSTKKGHKKGAEICSLLHLCALGVCVTYAQAYNEREFSTGKFLA